MKYWKQLLCFAIMALIAAWSAETRAKEISIGFSGPMSGPAAEYGQDCVNGIELAVKEINAAGGITVKGEKCQFNLVKLDDRNDPTQAATNARRFRQQNKAIAVFNGVFTTIAAMMKINQEKGSEFIIMAYTSTPKVTKLGNKLLVATTGPFPAFTQIFADWAWDRGWRKAAMVTTLGAYGDEWRQAFKTYWEKKGGKVMIDKPANYYRDTDFSPALTAALATKPDVMLIGGPSSGTALVIEQARGMGYTGGFIMLEQAKMDYISQILKGLKLMENTIGVAAVLNIPFAATLAFKKNYTSMTKRLVTWEACRNYIAMHALAKAIAIADTADDVYAIRASFHKIFPMLGDRYPSETWGITPAGRMLVTAPIQTIKGGKYMKPQQEYWWIRDQKEWNSIKKTTKGNPAVVNFKWFKAKIADLQ